MFYGGTIDFGFFPSSFNGDVQIFEGGTTTTPAAFLGGHVWTKPRGVSMVYIFMVGGGGGGGGGFTGATTTARGGGGGGACSPTSSCLTPAYFLPDVLYVFVGIGGIGGTGSAVDGTAGGLSFVSLSNLSAPAATPNKIMASHGGTAAGGGTAGTVAAGGTGGAVPTVETLVKMGAPISIGITQFQQGLIGAAGGAVANGAGVAVTAGLATTVLTPGAGGGGVTTVGQVGGDVTLQGSLDFADGNIAAAGPLGGAAGLRGGNGVQLWKPFRMTGGAGGGSADNAAGGAGGNGGIGCGGGGGGGGTTGAAGGNGGPGLVAIFSW